MPKFTQTDPNFMCCCILKYAASKCYIASIATRGAKGIVLTCVLLCIVDSFRSASDMIELTVVSLWATATKCMLHMYLCTICL